MSRSRYVQSFGRPYFAVYQTALAGMGWFNVPGAGVSELRVTFRLHGMPIARVVGGVAQTDELHPLLSVADYGLTPARDLLAIGITPSGRLKAVNKGGDVVQTAPAFIGVDDEWHEVVVVYDYGIASWLQFLIDGEDALAVLPVATVATPLLPTTFARMIAFNGAAGQTQCAVSIAEASVFWSSSGPPPANELIRWDFSNLTAVGGKVLADGDQRWSDGTIYDAGLFLGWYDPSPAPQLLGPPPTDDARVAWARGLQTIYSRRAHAKTNFYRRSVAWLS